MKEAMDRRAFLASLARIGGAALLGLAGLRAALGGAGESGSGDPAAACTHDGLCPRCGLLANCGNPQAVAYAEGAGREGP